MRLHLKSDSGVAVPMNMNPVLLLALVAIGLSVAMAGAWAIGRRPGLSGWTDAIWSVATGVAGLVVALAPSGGAAGPRAWIVAGLVMVWGLRLGGHIAVRSAGGEDDPRYADLRREWGEHFSRRLFQFLQVQAGAAWLLVLSILAAARNPAWFPAWSDCAGVLLLAIAIAGEAVADRQLKAFRADPDSRGKVCTAGLWGLSRHPNYFFEWLGWVSYAVIAMGPDFVPGWRWLGLSGPVLMYVLLVHVSGIPPLEAHMLRSRGEAFRDVQRRVRAFWPIPRFHATEDAG